jgi:hypothetical protein
MFIISSSNWHRQIFGFSKMVCVCVWGGGKSWYLRTHSCVCSGGWLVIRLTYFESNIAIGRDPKMFKFLVIAWSRGLVYASKSINSIFKTALVLFLLLKQTRSKTGFTSYEWIPSDMLQIQCCLLYSCQFFKLNVIQWETFSFSPAVDSWRMTADFAVFLSHYFQLLLHATYVRYS